MRTANIERKTRETDIRLSLNLDGGDVQIATGIGFFDHMLTAFAVHGGFGVNLSATGDLKVDDHHTVEDTGIVLGSAFRQALSDKAGIARFGSAHIPMDEALAFACADLSGRPFLYYDVPIREQKTGSFDTCLGLEFWRAFAIHSGITLHIRLEYGSNAHHILEAVFKAAAHALKAAAAPTGRAGVLSTKGVLA